MAELIVNAEAKDSEARDSCFADLSLNNTILAVLAAGERWPFREDVTVQGNHLQSNAKPQPRFQKTKSVSRTTNTNKKLTTVGTFPLWSSSAGKP